MKQDLLDVVEQGTSLYNAIDGNEVVNFVKLNNITERIVTNQVGEINYSTLPDGSISGDERLETNDEGQTYDEIELPMNEVFNDYINNIIGAPEGAGVTGGSGNHVEGVINNLWNDFSSQATHIEGKDNLFISNVRFMFGGNPQSINEATAMGVDWNIVKTTAVHIEGTGNISLYSDTTHIEGYNNTASNSDYSHIEGNKNVAYGNYSHIEGEGNNDYFSELQLTKEYGDDLIYFTNQINSIISNDAYLALNDPAYNVILDPNPYILPASRILEHREPAENLNKAIANEYLSYKYDYDSKPNFEISPYTTGTVFGEAGHTEGSNNSSFAKSSHSEGNFTSASSDYSHSEGLYSHTFGKGAHVEGGYNVAGAFTILSADGKDITRSISNQYNRKLTNQITKLTDFLNNTSTRLVFDEVSISRGDNNIYPYHNTEFPISTGFQKSNSSADGYINQDYINQSLSGEAFTNVIGRTDGIKGYQHAEGYNNLAFGDLTHSEGLRNWAITPGSHVEGAYNLVTYDTTPTSNLQVEFLGTHAEGTNNVVKGYGSLHVEGGENLVQSTYSLGVHVEGYQNIIFNSLNNNIGSHIEGEMNRGGNRGTHTEGGPWIARRTATVNGDNVTYNYGYENTQGAYTVNSVTVNWGPKVEWNPMIEKETVTLPDGTTFTNMEYDYLNFNMGSYSHIEGRGNTFTSGDACHIEGIPYSYLYNTTTSGNNTYNRYALCFHGVSGQNLHVEGSGNTGGGSTCHIEGIRNLIGGTGIHIEGYNNNANSNYSHAQGIKTQANGTASSTEGYGTRAYASASHAEGVAIIKNDVYPNASPLYTGNVISSILDSSSILGSLNIQATPIYDPTQIVTSKTLRQVVDENVYNSTKDTYSDFYEIIGSGVQATGTGSHAEGGSTQATASVSHAEGLLTMSTALAGHAEGICTYAYAEGSHTEGIGTNVNGANAYGGHAEGIGIKNSPSVAGLAGHAEGFHTQAIGHYAHAEGWRTYVTGTSGHSEGELTAVEGEASHAGGYNTKVTSKYAFAHGYSLNATLDYQTVLGKYNADTLDTLLVVGNGTANDSRSNALTLGTDGKLTISDIAFGTINSLTNEIARIWDAINTGGGGGGAVTLAGLTDVDLSNPTNGQVLMYDANTQKWVNGTVSDGSSNPISANVIPEPNSFTTNTVAGDIIDPQ